MKSSFKMGRMMDTTTTSWYCCIKQIADTVSYFIDTIIKFKDTG